MATETDAFSDEGQTGPEPRVATVDVDDARRGQAQGGAPVARQSVFVQRSEADQVLVVEGDPYPPGLADLPTVPAELVDGVWVAKPKRARGG